MIFMIFIMQDIRENKNNMKRERERERERKREREIGKLSGDGQ
jgi:hypothetical protein